MVARARGPTRSRGDPGVRARGWGQSLGPVPGAGGDTGQDRDWDCGWDQRGATGRGWHQQRDTGTGLAPIPGHGTGLGAEPSAVMELEPALG